MKKIFSLLLVLFLGFSFASLLQVNAEEALIAEQQKQLLGVNIFDNGNIEALEIGALGDPANAQGFGSGSWDSHAEVVADGENNKALKFSYTDEGKAFSSIFAFISGIKDGVKYHIELDYKVVGTTDNFGMRFAPICGDDVCYTFYSGNTTDGWCHASFDLTTNKDGAYDSIGVWFNSMSSADNAGYIDNITIKEVFDASKNIITYGDFEDMPLGNLTDPANKFGWGSGSWDSHCEIVADPLDNTNKALKFTYTVEGKPFCSFFNFTGLIEEEKTYQITFKYLVVGETDNFGMRFAGSPALETTFYSGAATDGWQEASFIFNTVKDFTYDSIQMWFNSKSSAENIGYVDDIVVKEVKKVTNLVTYGDIEELAIGALGDPANAQGFGSGSWDSHAEVVADGENNKALKFSYTDEGKAFSSIFKFVSGIKDGVKYHIELDYKVVGTTDNFGMRFAPICGDDVCYTFYSGNTTDGWCHASFDLTTNKDGAYDSIGVWFNSMSSADNAGYIDNIIITEVEEETPVTPVTPEPENPFDPEKTYYPSRTTTVNGDFEAFAEGTILSEKQLEGAWGSVSLDAPGKVVSKDGSKVIELSADGSHTYSSFFLMLPDTLEVGDMLRLSYDIKLELTGAAASHTAIDSCFVGGSNKSYYLVNYRGFAFTDTNVLTTGEEQVHYPVAITAKENGWYNISLDICLTNRDLIQTNSIRWLFTALEGEHMWVDNVNIYMLSETEWNYDVEVSEITITDGASINLKVGETKTLSVTVSPSDATDKAVTYESANTSVATVDATGKVTAVSAGATTITVKSANGVQAEIAVIVTANNPEPQPEQKPETSKGCGSSISISIVATISLLSCASFLALKKRKED